ncbi:hypothetical protein Pelo_19615 [Pelomyxa schiedti]|nr:hypothetical protein Pelo_19615 [Pelomyxa schiedti]
MAVLMWTPLSAALPSVPPRHPHVVPIAVSHRGHISLALSIPHTAAHPSLHCLLLRVFIIISFCPNSPASLKTMSSTTIYTSLIQWLLCTFPFVKEIRKCFIRDCVADTVLN